MAEFAIRTVRVDGKFTLGTLDSLDAGLEPDTTPLVNWGIKLTPTPRVNELHLATPPETKILEPILLITDATGAVKNPDTGDTEVRIWADYPVPGGGVQRIMWHSEITPPGSTTPLISKDWYVPTSATAVDLTTVAPIPGTTVINLDQWELLVANARSARDVAVLAAQSAALFKADTQALVAEAALVTGLTGEDEAVALLVDTPMSAVAASLTKVNAGVLTNAFDATLRATTNTATTSSARFTLIDDDGNNAVLTTLADIVVPRGIPLGVAIYPSGSAIWLESVKRAQLLTHQNTHGWEVLSHSMNHMRIDTVSRAEYIEDCETLLRVTREAGFDVRNIAYPYGNEGPNFDITARYYTGGFTTTTGRNKRGGVDGYSVQRIALGSMMDTNPSTLAQFKVLVDQAIAQNEWLVFMTHIGAADAAGVQLVEDVLDYVIAQGGTFVSPSDGLREFAPVGQVGRKSKNAGYWNVYPEGVVSSSRYLLQNFLPADARVEADPPLSTGGITRPEEWVFVAETAWTLGTGVVTQTGLRTGWERQEFNTLYGRKYVRRWNGAVWSPWAEIVQTSPRIEYTFPLTVIPAQSAVYLSVGSLTALAADAYAASPTGFIEGGLTWNVWAPGNGTIALRLANVTTSAVTAAARVWRIFHVGTG